MTEQEARDKLKQIDELRKRATTLSEIARWPMGVPSELRADKKRGWFKSIWRGTGEATSFGEITLTRDERSELVEWMRKKASRLNRRADEIAQTLGAPVDSPDHTNDAEETK